MKKTTFLLFFVASFAFAQTSNYQNGDVVDNFTVTDIDGVEHDLYSITAQGKYVWLDFFLCGLSPLPDNCSNF